ncbi:MAG: hypothetical protein ACQESG_01975 [Nanobdellota archaeon]
MDVEDKLKVAADKIKDDEDVEQKEQKKSNPLTPLSIILGVLLVLLGGLVAYAILAYGDSMQSEITIEVPQNVTKARNITTTVAEKVSFKKYFDSPKMYHYQTESIVGYLYYEYNYDEDTDIGRYTPYVVDDYQRRMRIEKITSGERKFFIKKQMTDELYNVTGQLSRLYPGFRIEVDNIQPTQPKMIEKVKQEFYEETVMVEKKVKLSLIEQIQYQLGVMPS